MRKIFFLLLVIVIYFFPTSTYAAEPIRPWNIGSTLPFPLASHISFSHKDNIIAFGGGSTSQLQPINIISSIDPHSGSLSQWDISNLNSISNTWHTFAKKDNYVYILGGATTLPTNSINSVYRGIVDDSGNIQDMQLQKPLPKRLSLGAAAIVNNRIYYVGGVTETLGDGHSDVNRNIYSAPINADGTLGGWVESGLAPLSLSGLSLVVNGTDLILLGGLGINNNFSKKVYKTTVNFDGTINDWQELAPLNEGMYRGGALKIGKTLITLGGLNENGFSDSVNFTDINLNGSIDPWSESNNKLPKKSCCGTFTTNNKFIYMIGGHDGGYFDSTYYTKVEELDSTSVPLFKQGIAPFTNGDPVWEGEEFDHAGAGQFGCGTTMAQCGCSTTSIAMVFKYHGIEKLPDGSELNPGTLNRWLKDNRGYNRNAGVDWRVAATLTKKAKTQNPNFGFDALEYRRGDSDKLKLTEDLNNGIPNILEVPGHFIVGTGIDQDTFSINDPFYNRTSLTAYNNTFSSTRRYIPSNTDLSYMTLYIDPNVDVIIKDGHGTVVGETEIEYEVNDATKTDIPFFLKPSLKVLSYAKPESGMYRINVSGQSTKPYQLDITIIDTEGNVTGKSFDGYVANGNTNSYILSFEKNSAEASEITKSVTFSSARKDISHAEKYDSINRGLAISLNAILSTAEYQSSKNKFVTRKLLEGGLKLLSESKRYNKLINQEAYEIIYTDFIELINKFK